jgi:DivIVA domain-containing protein
MDERFETHPDSEPEEDGEEFADDDLPDFEAGDEVEPPAESGGIADRLRAASFGVARRGYDRRQVDEFLARIARRVEAESGSFDPGALKRQLEKVGQSTTGILTAAEETARNLREDAAREVEELTRGAREMAERLRAEATEFAETTRERATEEARRMRMEATQKLEEATSAAEARADEVLEQSLERRRVLDARIGRLLEQRAGIVGRIRELSQELAALATSDELGSTGEHDDDLPDELVRDEPFDHGDEHDPDTGEQEHIRNW